MGFVLLAFCVRKGASKPEHPAVAAHGLAQATLQPDAALYIGCTTASEIAPLGYLGGSLRGVSIAGDMRVVSTRVDDERAAVSFMQAS